MSNEVKVNSKMNINELRHLHQEGNKLICPKCDSILLVAFSLDEANEQGCTPGIYCPNDTEHFYLHLNLREVRDRIWDKFKE